MKIINSYNVNDVETKFKLAMNPESRRLRDVEGERLKIAAWLLYSKDGENNILSMMTEDGEVYCTNSPTFMAAFDEMLDLYMDSGETLTAVKVVGGTSKNGRHFITCGL